MTHDEAQRERDRLAEEHPEATWLVAEKDPGEWSVVRVAMKPADPALKESVESRPRPPHPDDVRTALRRNVGGGYGA